MADTKISDLTAATNVDGADLVPIVQSATTKKATWSQVVGTTSKVSGSDFSTGSTSLVDVTGLTYAASANSLYQVEIMLVGTSSSTAGVDFSVAYSAAGASGTFYFYGLSGTTTGFTDGNVIGTGTTSALWVTSGAPVMAAKLYAGVQTGANAGNITCQILKWTSGTATVYIGSRMTVYQLA